MRSRRPWSSGVTALDRADIGDNSGKHQASSSNSKQRSRAETLIAAQRVKPAGIMARVTGAAMPSVADRSARLRRARSGRPGPRRGNAARRAAPPSTIRSGCRAPPDPPAVPAARCGRRGGVGGDEAARRPPRAPPGAPASPSATVAIRPARRAPRRASPRGQRQACAGGSRTMRTGERCLEARAAGRSARGSSASAVPMPTRIASWRARRRWTWARATGPVIGTWPARLRGRSGRRRKRAIFRSHFRAVLRAIG